MGDEPQGTAETIVAARRTRYAGQPRSWGGSLAWIDVSSHWAGAVEGESMGSSMGELGAGGELAGEQLAGLRLWASASTVVGGVWSARPGSEVNVIICAPSISRYLQAARRK